MSSFDSFREINKKYKWAKERLASRFVITGYSSIEVQTLEDEKEHTAYVVWNNDTISDAYVFTAIDDELNIGAVLKIGPKYAIILREDFIVKATDYHKYFALECNAQVGDTWGWFKGPQETYVSTSLVKDHVILSNARPMLILPRGPYHIGDKVVINGRPWLIQECDDYTSPGISYYSLEATRIAKECDDTSLLWEDEEDEVDKVQPNELIALSTEDAYYSCDKQIQIEKRELNQIAFRIPYGISDVTVFVRENGEEVAYKYKVVL